MHTENSFITLTYNSDHLPEDGSLDKKHFSDFMKRFRKRVMSQHNQQIRFYHCGEYGDKYGRPHYHAIIFGFDFPDKQFFKNLKSGFPVYTSELLEKCWPFGYASIGTVTYESAAYVARYCVKKITGKAATDHYQGKQPEYATMSLKPGIGSTWYKRYGNDVHPRDEVIINGRQDHPPKYYDKLFEVRDPDAFEQLKEQRKAKAEQNWSENMPDRLHAKETIKNATLNKKLPRKLDHD